MSGGPTQDRRDEILAAFRKQAEFCRARGAEFTAAIVTAAGDLLEENNETLWGLVGGFEGDPHKGALALRIAGALHVLVLQGSAGALAPFYAAPEGVPEASAICEAMTALLESERATFVEYVASAPQTNEINRASVLLFGFSEIAKQTGLPLELYEPGASAGLLLCWDQFQFDFGDFQWGAGETTIRSELRGDNNATLKPDIIVSGRCGCDLNPLDLTDPDTVLRMRSFIWPEDHGRRVFFDRAAGAISTVKPQLEKADALSWVRQKLETRAKDRASVFYHSVFAPYLSETDVAALEAMMENAGQSATNDAPLAWLRFEPEDVNGSFEFFLDLRIWPHGENQRLLRAHPHGLWVEPLSDF